ncbi:HAD-IIIA family hydrolase [Paraburkholderia bonniea]|uniref:HAD-IIIA family hydrolase n=1 Tax=Paraburkholderia bonniea TaxID=2152891 RepID=UPI0012922E74|nr:HAD-IIIA family hydrolase [Paraburkholderia bonniea]WJF89585.1 HAD-IIIA family hydrolase [Paraburkholderia bonniea]WJF92899.1 HAD-IIIA family hydrolase [Paraburkholderia bonniea]
MKQVVILAGGKGTRLRERLGDRPKPLVDICGMPLLERQILLAKKFGFTDVVVLVNYRAEQIVEFCRANANWGLAVQCIDEGEARGTAGAVLNVLDVLAEEFLVMYGDTMLEVDFDRFHAFHAAMPETAATLFLHPNDHPHDSDLVDVDETGRVQRFYPYPHDASRYYPNLVNAALYWVRKASLEGWREQQGMFDFGKDLFPQMLARGLVLRGYNSPEYIKDSGTPARLDKVSADLLSGKIARAALSQPQAAVFLDRDGTLNQEVDHLHSAAQFELLPGVEQAIRRLNQAEYRCCVVTNQPVVARGECTLDELRQIHNKMETLLGRMGAYIDRLYYCPHHPDKGFEGEVPELKFACSCRKPSTGMVDQAVSELNIERARSWFVGDTSTDMLTAQRAGLKSILVETGYAGLDQKYRAEPDFTVPDLTAAVDFMLDLYPALSSQCDKIAQHLRPGEIVYIAGQSRSGKTTFANALRYALQRRNMKAQVLSTDRWLLDEPARTEGVLGRHDLPALRSLLETLAEPSTRPAEVVLPAYLKLRREQIKAAQTIAIGPDDVVLVEGIMAFHAAVPATSSQRFFVEIDEPSRRERVIRAYLQRGLTQEAAEAVYAQRLVDEVPVLLAAAGQAPRISLPRAVAHPENIRNTTDDN